jgi:hypothetical protein
MPTVPPGVIADHIAAVNAHESDAILATFAPDAYVSAQHGEYVGIDAVRQFVQYEVVADNISMDVREVVDHRGDTIVRAVYDGDYDKTNLPDEVVLSNYFVTRDGKIVSLIIVPSVTADPAAGRAA